MNKFCKIIFIACISVINIFNSIKCGNLLGTTGLNYMTFPQVFRSGQRAQGMVRMTNGFTVATPASGVGSTHGSIAYLDTCLSVSGGIDLRTTNTMFLRSDLTLDNGVTFSDGGQIYGYDRALILNGDLTIQANSTFHIGGRIVIDGQGNTININDSSKFFIDANATLTLRNLVLKNTRNQPGNPCLQCSTFGSNLCLQDVVLNLADDFYFNCGQLFINNDVAITGTSALVYCSPIPMFIDSDSTLYFDVGTTFSIAPSTFTDCLYSTIPTTTTSNFIFMADQTSQLYLNGCSFFTTLTGLRLTKGTVLFDNNVTIRSNASNNLNSIGSLYQLALAQFPQAGAWSPDGKFVAAAGYQSSSYLYVTRFSGSAFGPSTSTSSGVNNPQTVAWSPDGKFIAVANYGTTLQVFPFSVSTLGAPVLGSPISGDGATNGQSLAWSPDGRFIVVGTLGPSLQLYVFMGNGVRRISSVSLSSGYNLYSVAWSPDGRFVSVANYNGNKVEVLPFTGNTFGSSISFNTSASPLKLSWSPDGRFIAVIYYSTNILQVIPFTGSVFGPSFSTSTSTSPNSVSWSADGRYIVVVTSISGGGTLQIFPFKGNSFGSAINTGCGNSSVYVSFSKDGRFVLVINYGSPGTCNLQIFPLNYVVNMAPQAISNSIVFGNSALGSAYDLSVRALAGANIEYNGIVNYDCVS